MATKLVTFGGKQVKIGSSGAWVSRISREPFPMNDFTDIGTVYASLSSGDTVAFIIRHTEREGENITADGIQYAQNTGAKLIGGIAGSDEMALYSSTVQRCIDTANYIAQGSGRTGTAAPTTLGLITGCPYEGQKPTDGWEDYSLFAYDLPSIKGGTFHSKSDITSQILNLVKTNMTKKLNIFVTHDQLLEIFVVDMCSKQISLKFWEGAVNDGINEKRWITYLAGMAIIRHSDGTYEYAPVKSLDRGFQRSYDSKYVPG